MDFNNSSFYNRRALCVGLTCLVLVVADCGEAGAAEPTTARRPSSVAEQVRWLQNMVWYHHYSLDEMQAALGVPEQDIRQLLATHHITDESRPVRPDDAPLLVVPYPGGRHPRIGFLEGAIDPQRETKVSVFLPWDPNAYVVVDVPEAIWSNLGLTYLAHTHVPTIWTQQQITLPPLEWQIDSRGRWHITRELPNGIAFGTTIQPERTCVRMSMWLRNGTKEPLSDLRVQQCVMLKGAPAFAEQSNDNKLWQAPYAAVHDPTAKRWIITAWSPLWRVWGNAKCPCLHADPKFADCAPGETVRMAGWLSFFAGDDIQAELRRIDALPWRDGVALTGVE